MPDYRTLAKETETAWEPLFTRLQNDDNLINLGAYTLRDTDKATIPHVLSVTLNDIAVFVSKVETFLGDAQEQVMITSEDKNLDTSKVETIINALFLGGNDLLLNQQEHPLDMAVDQQTCRRGGVAAKVIFNIDETTGELSPLIRVLDRNRFTFGTDEKGLVWTSYKTKRARNKILAEYPDIEHLLDNKTQDIEVQDIWTREHNEIWIDGKEVLRKPNLFKDKMTGFGYVPIVIRIVPMGSTYGTIEFWGESLLFLIRGIMPELNRLLSIAQSMNQKELDHALQQKVPEGDVGGEAPDHAAVTKPGAVTQVEIGGGFESMPLGQLREQAWRFYQVFETRMQRGGANAFDLGTFTQTMSFVALEEIAEGRAQIYLPRLNTRGALYDGITKMGINQIQTSGHSQFTIGNQTYDVADLEGEYDIKHKYTNRSPGRDAARWGMSAAAGADVSKKFKREHILELEDPEGEERQLRVEEAELLFVSVKKSRVILALAEDADAGSKKAELELKLALDELGVTLDQIMAGDIEPEQGIPKEPQKPSPLGLPVTDRAGQPRSQALIPKNGGNEHG